MPAQSRSQQRLFCMALAVRHGDLKRSEVRKEVLDIVDSDMTDKQIKDFTVMKEGLTPLADFIGEGRIAFVTKEYNDGPTACLSVTPNGTFKHLALVTETTTQNIRVFGYEHVDDLQDLYKLPKSVCNALDGMKEGEAEEIYNGGILITKIY